MIIVRYHFFSLTLISFFCSTAELCLPSKPRLLSPLWSMGMMPWVRSTCLGRKRRVPRPMAHHSCPCTACSMEKPILMKCSRSAACLQRAIGTVWFQPNSAWWDNSTAFIFFLNLLHKNWNNRKQNRWRSIFEWNSLCRSRTILDIYKRLSYCPPLGFRAPSPCFTHAVNLLQFWGLLISSSAKH